MRTDRPEPRLSTCRIERGLYVLRYVDSTSRPGPVATLRVMEGEIGFVPAPGRVSGSLDHPGQATTIVAQRGGVFEIQVSAAAHGSSTDANFSLDLLDAGLEFSTDPGDRASFDRPPSPVIPIEIGAHVSRRGDVRASAGEWIAGPDSVLPIEGLSIDTMRHDVCVDVRVQTTRTPGSWSRWFRDGEFAGTRQRAESITAIALALRGDRARDYMIAADVMQLGAPSRRQDGQEVEFFSYDPLVGFRIELKAASQSLTGEIAQSAARLRVFRARR